MSLKFETYKNEAFRIVESQYFISTRKLVDSPDEQLILEELIDKTKPKAPKENSRGSLHYLLYTPFRYPPLKSGGRFHNRFEQSVFYASEKLETAMSEVAYNRFLFMEQSEAKFQPSEVEHMHFVVSLKSDNSVLLTEGDYAKDAKKISDPLSYRYSQNLGGLMREEGVELFTFYSARVESEVNIGIFSPEAFAKNQPLQNKTQHWSVFISKNTVEFKRPSIRNRNNKSISFNYEDFCVNSKFPIVE